LVIRILILAEERENEAIFIPKNHSDKVNKMIR